MITQVTYISLLVNSYEDAIEFYTNKLGFVVISDALMPSMGDGMRWVVIAANSDSQTMISLSLAKEDVSESLVGRRGGGYPFFTMFSDNIEEDMELFGSRGVIIKSKIGLQSWGKDCTIEDLYGNLIYIVEPVEDQDPN